MPIALRSTCEKHLTHTLTHTHTHTHTGGPERQVAESQQAETLVNGERIGERVNLERERERERRGVNESGGAGNARVNSANAVTEVWSLRAVR